MTSTRNLTEARNLMPGQLVDLDQLSAACLFLWDDDLYPHDRFPATGKHRVVHVALTAAGRRTYVHFDNERRLEIRSDRKLVVLDRDLASDTEAAAAEPTFARLVERHYGVSGAAFVIVECETCLTALNSGHHYVGEVGRAHAARLADQHNAAYHR